MGLLDKLFRETYASGPPTTGRHAPPERIWNLAPEDGAPAGWVCVTAGEPGTWLPFATVGTADTTPPYSGLRRVVVLGLGESGMAGAQTYDYPNLPTGFPVVDGSVSVFSASRVRTLPTEAPSDPGVAPVDTVFPQSGLTWADRFCQLLAQRLGPTCEVVLVLCAKSGTTSYDWAVGGSLYTAAVARAQAALALPGATLGCMLLDQGLNDAPVAGWATRWGVIDAAMRAALGSTTCRMFVRHQYAASSIAPLRAEQATFCAAAPSQRILFESPNGPFDVTGLHLTQAALMTQAATAAAAEATNQITLGTPAVSLAYPTRAEVTALSSVVDVWDMDNVTDGASWTGRKNGYVMTQPVSGQRPTLVVDAGNGRPAFRFAAASNQCLRLPAEVLAAYAAGTQFAFFCAYRALGVAGAGGGYICLASLGNSAIGNDGVQAMLLVSSGDISQPTLNRSLNAGGPFFQLAAGVSRGIKLGQSNVYGAAFNGPGTSRFWLQSGMVAKRVADSNTVTVPNPNVGRLGCWITGAAELAFFDGYMSRAIFALGSISQADAEICARYCYAGKP